MSYDDPNETTQPAASPGRRPARQGVGGSPVGSTVSIVLAVVAVVVGFLILRNITDDDGGSAGGVVTPESTVPSTVDTTIAQATTTTLPPLVTEGATVIVANASGVPGSAGRMTTELQTAGFTTGEATNATSGPLEQSIVYYDAANAAALDVANSVARVMGGLTVEVVPSPPPIEGGSLGDAGVVVMLGTAQADRTLNDLAPTTVVSPPPVAGGTTPAATTPDTTG
jgi:hypothetical protein